VVRKVFSWDRVPDRGDRAFGCFGGTTKDGWALNARAVHGIWPVAKVEERGCLLRPGEVIEGDGAVGVWELVGDVGRDGGAARGDAALGEEDKEPGEELVDVDGGVEFGKLGGGVRWRGRGESLDGCLTLRFPATQLTLLAFG